MNTTAFKNLAIIAFIISSVSILMNILLVNSFYQSGGGFNEMEVSIVSISQAGILFLCIIIGNLFLLNPYVLKERQSSSIRINKIKLILSSILYTLIFCLVLAVILNSIDNSLSLAYGNALNEMFVSEEMDAMTMSTFVSMPLFLQSIFVNILSIVLAQLISINLCLKLSGMQAN
ncbi:hypothetical protein ABWH96_11365 [Marivirga tractuosa]|uniref:hypothetical protein n=1 Tax=Marivirga tractuosa TaxID=1006 RepID=UPI0035D0D6B0